MNDLVPSIEQMHTTLRSLYAQGTMEKPVYLKCIVSLAYEYLVAGLIEDARVILGECDQEYVSNHLPGQMVEDTKFHALAYYVAQKLADAGISSGDEAEEPLLAFMQVGKA